jgi:PHD/YefM family antitoxin component YafN of YafNO toxin-antitoxin module
MTQVPDDAERAALIAETSELVHAAPLPPRPSRRLTRIGLTRTAAWLGFLAIMAVAGWDMLFKQTPNEFGDMLAGVFAPLAFLWLVLGFFQQGKELKASVAALELQGKKLRNFVEQQRELVTVSREQMESANIAAKQNLKNLRDAERAILTGWVSSGQRMDNGMIRIHCRLANRGRGKVKVVEPAGCGWAAQRSLKTCYGKLVQRCG